MIRSTADGPETYTEVVPSTNTVATARSADTRGDGADWRGWQDLRGSWSSDGADSDGAWHDWSAWSSDGAWHAWSSDDIDNWWGAWNSDDNWRGAWNSDDNWNWRGAWNSDDSDNWPILTINRTLLHHHNYGPIPPPARQS